MAPSLLNRYIARELTAPILLCLVIFTLVLITGRLVQIADLVIAKGVDIGSILKLTTAMLPPFLAVALPLSFLMGSMLGIGRMCADNETVAMRAAGIGLPQIGRPLLLIALCFTALTALVACWAAPWGKQAFKTTLIEIARSKASISLQKQQFIRQFTNLTLYANHLDERSGEMSGVFIVTADPGKEQLLIIADNGQLLSDPQGQALTLQLQNGTIHRQGAGSDDRKAYQVIRFTNYTLRPELGKVATAPKFALRTSPNEMSTGALWEAASGAGDKELAARGELHQRLSAPLAPLLFALFILPCAVQNQRSGRSGAFVTGLLVYLVYFLMISLAEKATANLGVHPLFSFWTLHLGFLAAGLYLVRQSTLERPGRLLVWVDRGVLALRHLLRRHDAHT